MPAGPVRIEPQFVERVWGVHDLAPWFGQQSRKIGEVWFPAGEILIKFLFTSEPLSVQVHPDDDYAARHENSRGKTEMWYVLRASPGARIALGFLRPVTREQARSAAEDGSIEQLLGWFEPAPGDTFLTPARTVHALGGGLVVCEIQQISDVTYRLYDYNRGRPLHLDKGLEVADLGPHPGKEAPGKLAGGGRLLARCAYFATELLESDGPMRIGGGSTLIVLSGHGLCGGEEFRQGEVWRIEEDAEVRPAPGATLLRTYVPND